MGWPPASQAEGADRLHSGVAGVSAVPWMRKRPDLARLNVGQLRVRAAAAISPARKRVHRLRAGQKPKGRRSPPVRGALLPRRQARERAHPSKNRLHPARTVAPPSKNPRHPVRAPAHPRPNPRREPRTRLVRLVTVRFRHQPREARSGSRRSCNTTGGLQHKTHGWQHKIGG
jgi:hypothetical protein